MTKRGVQPRGLKPCAPTDYRMRDRRPAYLALSVLLSGCTGLSVYQLPMIVGDKPHTVTRVTGNFGGPGVACLMIHDSQGTLVYMSPACAAGPDAGVAVGTAGMQGGGMALGAAVFGASLPTHRSQTNNTTTVSGTGGNATTDSHAIQATDNFITTVGKYQTGSGGPPSAGGR